MIKLSDMLDAMGDGTRPEMLMIREAKRLESLETPCVEPERKPLVDGDGDKVYIIVDVNGFYADWQLTKRDAENDARDRTQETGQPHTVCQVMAPESSECPMIPVATFTPTPERPHEWVIYRDKGENQGRWYAFITAGHYWATNLVVGDIQRFATAAEAQDYIDDNDIKDAYPWAVPKLTS